MRSGAVHLEVLDGKEFWRRHRLVVMGDPHCRPLQDTSTRVWDLRKPSESVVTLCGRMGAVRSLRYSPDGRLLAASEPADFVQLYDVTASYTRCHPLPSPCHLY